MRALPALVLLALAAAAPSAAGAVTLGLVTPGTGSEAVARAAQAARSAAEEKGWTVEARDASVDGDALAQLVRREGVAGLVLVAVRPEFDPAGVQAARAAGLPIVTVLAGASPAARFDLAVNQYALGADVGAYVLGQLGYGGRLVTLRADADPGARARARVLDLMLQDAPGVSLAASLDRGSGPEEALRADLDRALAAAAGPAEGAPPLAVWCATDALALLAEEVLKARGFARERVTLVGVGGGPAAFARLRDPAGLLTATAAIPYELLGEAAVDVLEDIAAGTPAEQIATGPYVFVDTVIVDRGSVPAEDELPW